MLYCAISITFSPGETIEEVPEYVQSSDTESDSELWDTSLFNSRQMVPRGKFIFLLCALLYGTKYQV